MPLNLPTDYNDFLKHLKNQIRSAQAKASLAVNQQMIQLYHNIGLQILKRQSNEKWGSIIIDHIAADLKKSFPDLKGFSSRNLKYMRKFAEKCPNLLIGQQAAAQLPWFHIVTILTKIEDSIQQEWYAIQTVQESWSRQLLEKNIQNKLIERHGKAVGILLCREKNHLIAQYALNGVQKPIGIAEYQLVKNLPDKLAEQLPSVEDLEIQLDESLIEGNHK